MWASAFAVLIPLAAVFWLIRAYNRLVDLRNRSRNAFSQIDVQLKRRHDLIPNLVETAKGYLRHERATLESVVRARLTAVDADRTAAAAPGDPAAIRALASAENELGGALARLLALVEAYPDLKGDETMARLMEELASTENRIAFARQAYNDSVTSYNTATETFPNVFLARPMGFVSAEFFRIEDDAERRSAAVAFR